MKLVATIGFEVDVEGKPYCIPKLETLMTACVKNNAGVLSLSAMIVLFNYNNNRTLSYRNGTMPYFCYHNKKNVNRFCNIMGVNFVRAIYFYLVGVKNSFAAYRNYFSNNPRFPAHLMQKKLYRSKNIYPYTNCVSEIFLWRHYKVYSGSFNKHETRFEKYEWNKEATTSASTFQISSVPKVCTSIFINFKCFSVTPWYRGEL